MKFHGNHSYELSPWMYRFVPESCRVGNLSPKKTHLKRYRFGAENLDNQTEGLDMGVSKNRGTPKTPQNGHF